MLKKFSALTLAVTLALTLVGSAFAQSGGRGGFVAGGYSESVGLIYGESGGFALLGVGGRREGLLTTGSDLFYFKESVTLIMVGQTQITAQPAPPSSGRIEPPRPRRIEEWLIAFKKPKPPYPHVVFITEIEKVYHADDECPKILLKRKLPITLKQALEWEYEPCPVCVPKNEKETK